MRLKVSEADIQKTILEYLNIKGHFAFRVNTQGVPKWGNAGNFAGFRPSPMKGVSDILGISKEGKMFAIEVKAPTGKISNEQLDFIFNISERGGIAFIAYKLDDVINHGL